MGGHDGPKYALGAFRRAVWLSREFLDSWAWVSVSGSDSRAYPGNWTSVRADVVSMVMAHSFVVGLHCWAIWWHRGGRARPVYRVFRGGFCTLRAIPPSRAIFGRLARHPSRLVKRYTARQHPTPIMRDLGGSAVMVLPWLRLSLVVDDSTNESCCSRELAVIAMQRSNPKEVRANTRGRRAPTPVSGRARITVRAWCQSSLRSRVPERQECAEPTLQDGIQSIHTACRECQFA